MRVGKLRCGAYIKKCWKGEGMCPEEGGGRQAKKRRGEARMGAEPLLPRKTHTHTQPNSPLILGLQPSALIDHVAKIDSSLLAQIPGERGGSIPVRTPSLLPVSFSFSFSLLSVWWFCVNVFGCCWAIRIKLGRYLGIAIFPIQYQFRVSTCFPMISRQPNGL